MRAKSYRSVIADYIEAADGEDLLVTATNILSMLDALIVICDDCGGAGFDGCDDCDATGSRSGGKCRSCIPAGSGEVACPTCWGRGYVINETAW